MSESTRTFREQTANPVGEFVHDQAAEIAHLREALARQKEGIRQLAQEMDIAIKSIEAAGTWGRAELQNFRDRLTQLGEPEPDKASAPQG